MTNSYFVAGLIGLYDIPIFIALTMFVYIPTIRKLKKQVKDNDISTYKIREENKHFHSLMDDLNGAEVYQIIHGEKILYILIYKYLVPGTWQIFICLTPSYLNYIGYFEISLQDHETISIKNFRMHLYYQKRGFSAAFLEKILEVAKISGKHWSPFLLTFDTLEELELVKILFLKFNFFCTRGLSEPDEKTLIISPYGTKTLWPLLK